ncbi:transcription factor WhiB family protein [Mycobacterium xenopi 4042]|uniref:Transcription factor WhiB family protein n=1 Tax=Mycobacterium xenopi 4042 TaxID=1299334 RepID=X7YLE8_MYCXE|nr:transcription factor WhiB family protein [Mycobacterium xenopi 4042]
MPQPEQLPGPNADIWDWQLRGLCRGVDSSVFFHPDGERGRAVCNASAAPRRCADGAQ